MKIIYVALLIYALSAVIGMLVAGVIWLLNNLSTAHPKKKRSRQSFRDLKQMLNERNLKLEKRKAKQNKNR